MIEEYWHKEIGRDPLIKEWFEFYEKRSEVGWQGFLLVGWL